MVLFIISAILFLVGGIVFSAKVSQNALDAHFKASVEEVGGLA